MNQTTTKIPFQLRLQESFQKYPHRIAIECGELHITYALLESKANCIAAWITREGIPPESFIGICLDDKSEIITVMIGILKARCAFTVLDTALPKQRLLNLIELTQLQLVFTNAKNKERVFHNATEENQPFMGNPANLIVVDDGFYHTHRVAIMPPLEPGRADYTREDKIYIYFTSGTTGKPKAIVGMNKSLLHFIEWEIETFGIDNTFRFSQWITPGFDAFLRDVFTPLCAGAVICMPPRPEMMMDSQELILWLNSRHIRLIHCVPSMFRLLNPFTTKKQADENFRVLKYVLMAGEKIIPHELTRWFLMFGERIQLINLYGTSETTMAKTCFFIHPADCNRSTIPVGLPIPGARIFILDKEMQVCHKKSAGEIYIRTPFRSHGYYNDPEANKEKFIPNPFSQNSDDWFHKTGDLGRLLEDGNIEVLGRMDRQVKIRGVRVEPEEIESIILQHPAVAEAAIIDKTNERGETYLCAYFVPRANPGTGSTAPTQNITATELVQYLATHLPSYMVPSACTLLAQMPLTANGKIDRKALPEPRLEQGDDYTAPATTMEENLVNIWSEVLAINGQKISTNANFFHLGGHSLNATILMSKIHRQLGIKVPLSEIFKNPYIKTLAHYITTHDVASFLAIEPVEQREYYPLSSAQKRLFFLQQFDPASTSYNMPMVIPLGKGMATHELEGILNKLIVRHENFRTSFIPVQDEIVQRIHPHVEFTIELFALAAGNSIAPLIGNFVRPFDLSRAPLLRCGIIRTHEEEYFWLLDMHHIISDGTSQTILTGDFFALSQGQALPPLSLQYKDFSQWQNNLFANGRIQAQEEYWVSQLAGAIPRLELPVDHKRPAIFSFAGARYAIMMAREDALKFRALGNTHGATLFMNFLAALNALFYKYTSQTDIIIGSAIAGRHHADLQQIVGMFVNTLVLRNFPTGEKTYLGFLTEVRESCIHAFENQDMQFEQLVEKLDLERDPARNPLFDISLVVQNFWQTDGNNTPREGQTLAPRYENNISKFDITFVIHESGEDIGITTQYYTGIFAQETISRLISHLLHLINVVCQNPVIPLKDIEIISAPEKQRILDEFNSREKKYRVDKTIHALFEEQVARTPDFIAILDTTSASLQLSYAELNERANHLAHYLIFQGIGESDIVGLLADRSVEMILGILAILKAGGAYIPLNPKAPVSRSLFMLNDCGTHLLLTTPRLAEESETVTKWAGQTIIIADQAVNGGELPLVAPSHLAYVIFTSGSTGTPKGVPITHANLCPLLHWGEQFRGMCSQNRVLQNLSYYFDASVWELFSTLTTGAMLVVVSEERVLNPATCIPFMQENDITMFHVTPTQYQHLIGSGGRLETLKYLFFGGETLTINLLKRSFASVPGDCRVFNMYGPTENTIISSLMEIPRDQEHSFAALTSVPIGVPVANTSLLVVDNYFNLCPVNITGQLVITGDGLAAGYLNNPELTAAAFVSSSTLAKTLYQTGDLARWLPDGTLEFLGRIDQQVKIRGFRIELGEIESRLLTHGDIKEAVVLARQEGNGEHYLCAYIVSAQPWQDSQWRDWLAKDLPDYMIPSYFVPIEKIPLTANGKIDQNALPEPQLQSDASYLAPRNAMERKLQEIWADVLNISKVVIGINSNFFQLGGHSLKATMLTAMIHKQLQVKIPLAELFKNPTIIRLAQYINHSVGNSFRAIPAVEKKEYYSLSSLQKRLYILQHMNPTSTAYNMPQVIPLGVDVDAAQLTRTFTFLIERHESLRTSFQTVGDLPVQKVHEPDEVEFKLDYYQDSSFSHTMSRFVRPFDLSQPPLLRAGLAKVFQADVMFWVLVVDIHHSISDGVSQEVLARDFRLLLNDIHHTLPRLHLQYKDFAEWQNSPAQTQHIKQQEAYWLHEFAGEIPVLNLPLDFPRPEHQHVDGENVTFSIEPHTLTALTTLAKECEVTMYMMFLALLNVLLAKLCGQEDIVIGTASSGRQHADLEQIIGMFVNTLVLRNYPSAEKTFTDFLKEIKTRTLAAFENQDYPFEDLVDKVAPSRNINRNPLFDVLFNFMEVDTESRTKAVLPHDAEQTQTPTTLNYEAHPSKFDMTLTITKTGIAELYFNMRYSTRLFKTATIKKVVHYFQELVSHVAENPAQTISQITIVSQVEMEDLLGASSTDLENE